MSADENRAADRQVCVCGDTASCHADGGTGTCWPCACSRFELRTPEHPKRANYGFRYTGD